MSATAVKRVLVATGCSSGLGLAALTNLLSSSGSRLSTTAAPSTYHVFLGHRSPAPSAALLHLVDTAKHNNHTVKLLSLDLTSFESVREFADRVSRGLGKVTRTGDGTDANGQGGEGKLDQVLLCAGVYKAQKTASVGGRCEEVVVNHFAQHLLLLLLEPFLSPSPEGRVVFVSSSLQNTVKSTESLRSTLLCESVTASSSTSQGASSKEARNRYASSKLIQMISARFWKSRLGSGRVICVSPGFIPQTGLNRESSWMAQVFLWYILSWAPFCSTVDQGATAISSALLLPHSDLVQLESLTETENGSTTPLYLDNRGKTLAPNKLSAEKGLVEEWCPKEEGEMRGW